MPIGTHPDPAMIGKINDYRQVSGPKSLAVCVNWDASTLAKPAFFEWAFATHMDKLKPKNHAEIDKIAIDRCKSFASFECDCLVIDRNDRNVLAFPKAWLDRQKTDEARAKAEAERQRLALLQQAEERKRAESEAAKKKRGYSRDDEAG